VKYSYHKIKIKKFTSECKKNHRMLCKTPSRNFLCKRSKALPCPFTIFFCVAFPSIEFVLDLHCFSSIRHFTENSKQYYQKMKLRGLVSNFFIHIYVSYLYIPTIGPPILQSHFWKLMWASEKKLNVNRYLLTMPNILKCSISV
jgi:hypothetical protein